MGLKYKVVSKRPGGMAGEQAPKYYPVITDREMADLNMVIDRMAKTSNVNQGVVHNVLYTFRDTLMDLLEQGYSVKLDDLGIFSIHASAEGQDDPKKVTQHDIKNLKLTFLPDKKLKKDINLFKVRKAKTR